MMTHWADRCRTISLTLALGLLTACASSPPEPVVDYNNAYDFQQIRTMAFLPHNRAASGDSPRALMSDMQINRINLALEQAVENKGFEIVDDPKKADALLTWHLVVQEKTDVRTTPGGASGGYYRGYNRRAAYSCWNCGTDVSVRQYTQGTFIVDVMDPKMNQSVWRSVIQSRLKGELQREQEPYNQAANRIMASFPPY